MSASCSHAEANREKNHAALSSLFWALFLTVIKLTAGLATNSLGILSEALHSGLDLVAAGITFFAVRVASRPADKAHPYGYGKIENLSALAETLLLLVTCVWIVREAVERLFFSSPEIKPSWWGVGIILVSLLVDVNRSAMLRRVAKKHKSQALEADALHFSTDIWSSGVVLIGLLCVQLSTFLPPDHLLRAPLHMADAVAALFVSGIVVVVGIRLSRRAITTLLDGGGREHAEILEQTLAKRLPQYTVRRLRVRESGADVFMDITVDAPETFRLDEAHDVSRLVEDIAHEIVPAADITVHVEPRVAAPDNLLQIVRTVANIHSLSIHNLVLSEQADGLLVYLHVEAPPAMPLQEAHAHVDTFEKALEKRLNAVRIYTHIEPEDRRCLTAPVASQQRLRLEQNCSIPRPRPWLHRLLWGGALSIAEPQS
ncbi:MAG: cation diffusion facilitator family transporter, partial [Bilophila sp.]